MVLAKGAGWGAETKEYFPPLFKGSTEDLKQKSVPANKIGFEISQLPSRPTARRQTGPVTGRGVVAGGSAAPPLGLGAARPRTSTVIFGGAVLTFCEAGR